MMDFLKSHSFEERGHLFQIICIGLIERVQPIAVNIENGKDLIVVESVRRQSPNGNQNCKQYVGKRSRRE